MYDLIYGDSEIETEVRNIFKDYPKFKIEDASDEVHEDRFSIDLEIDEREYYRTMMIHGLPAYSLVMQLISSDPEKIAMIKELLKELHETNPEIFKE
jgi:hypothetical protein